MTNDPFANATTADAATEAESTTAAKPGPTRRDGKVVVTLKGGRDFDAPWIVHHADSVAEAEQLVRDSRALMKLSQEAAAHFAGLAPGKPAPQGTEPAARSAPAAKPAYQQAPGGEGRHCKHGEMVFKSGVAKNGGKPWSAFMCPAPAGTPDQCEKQWLR
ncbi:hypothetical protein NONI108955_41210 [Nocardia ninae]|uniref:Uncharacterized protein n=1 Tax=Nocardia ninae NBRC 108245 TaxID=1210091 RepID=A0A511MJS7_9NOCA|nr:hypothetical protein [Nocardia ninae]GEM40890.1 hypothetical protein NN4_54090 [Nocardia ninae NBRC 108245]